MSHTDGGKILAAVLGQMSSIKLSGTLSDNGFRGAKAFIHLAKYLQVER